MITDGREAAKMIEEIDNKKKMKFNVGDRVRVIGGTFLNRCRINRTNTIKV